MRKIILLSAGIVLTIGLISAIAVYRTHLRGVWPAFSQPEQDIVQLLEESTSTPIETPRTQTKTQEPEQQSQGPLILPRGFFISIFAKDLADPRVLAFDPNGILLASITAQGKVVALIDKNNDGKSEETRVIANGLNRPHGIAVECVQNACKLYIAENDKVSGFDYALATLTATQKRVIAPLPTGGGHFTRTLLPYGNSLLVSVGSSCNVCVETDQNRAKILEIDIASGGVKTFATGLRNAVFMAFHPFTREIWATEMGRDLLGDDTPPDEINIIKKDANYGWPICYGKNIHDTGFDKNTYIRNPCMEPFETQSYIDIPAHSAPLGLAFIPDSWPAEYRNDLLIAYHGSWNRSVPTGYKIVRMKLDANGTYQGVEDFITGWLVLSSAEGFTPSEVEGLIKNSAALGRPVDILFASSGTAYISDDKAGVIYRLQPPK
ncbi:hypothetical protein A2524_00475 [Candidatus Wolfebacteria bacterium RIFOXYD12_FULL_48_21]|uniref:Pyrroloquinoline quinone-dependent pyranose dehydrogenase beta-propeller domain-containing protein n=1 Tax=Candidatus Wolfebacteria bacterium RIFOXYD1_FULL_48_65 TaxID=1802561 RepID=A0A1F8E1A8_9BACT|nr:MAG: hypothetical protein A2610_01360 [Candidatus Wolfebacteria bacterium RIFOXYD1_FULL_48_65]OGM94914.1 MAG: hypothetical protein A2524_00475 [Candidatus Wolfebacteria bacterium RIFOXYD12_FULL_48_21]